MMSHGLLRPRSIALIRAMSQGLLSALMRLSISAPMSHGLYHDQRGYLLAVLT
jgi:hypothetical protein